MDKKLWEKCAEFHGHICPGLAIGFKAGELLMQIPGFSFSKDEEIVCVTENDACGVDAIQVITGCTMGKGNLIYRATGKQAYSFFNRDSGESVRLVLKPLNKERDRDEQRNSSLTPPGEDIFEIKKPIFDIPEKARLFNTIQCEQCHEGTAEHLIRLNDGKKLCPDCFQEYHRGWQLS